MKLIKIRLSQEVRAIPLKIPQEQITVANAGD